MSPNNKTTETIDTCLPTRAYIGIGSNLNEPLNQVTCAIQALQMLPDTALISVSPWYASKALENQEQPDYVNGVAAIDTQLSPHELLEALQMIENQQGRKRDYRWAPRTLDLDILLFGQHKIDSERLTIPHPEMTKRNFVLYPLFDIAADLVFPNGIALESLLRDMPPTDLEPVKHEN